MEPQSSSLCIQSRPIILRLISKRRTWLCLFIAIYSLLVSSSCTFLSSIISWYNVTSSESSSFLPALYASTAMGAVFGFLAMAAAVAVAVPAMVVTWITVLVMMSFFGKPRKVIVAEGRKLTAEIGGLVARILIREGNCVVAVCFVLGYFLLMRSSSE